MYKYIVSHNTSATINAITGEPVEIDTGTEKLFHDDTFVIDESDKIVLTSSPTRSAHEMPAVLCLKNNRTYGKTPNNKRHLYKCVPDDKHIPPFLVAYEMKNVGFSKVFANKYILIKFLSWTNANPHAIITNTIGDVDVLENYYEYQLHCHGLAHSIQPFIKTVASNLVSTRIPRVIPCEPQDACTIITIDPHGTRDYDDAISITPHSGGTTTVSVYIANVSACLDAYDLWGCIDTRVSTIYLPDKPRPMLPPRLSEHDCSLISGSSRVALTMDVLLCSETGAVLTVSFRNSYIMVSHNYVYEDPALLSSRMYTGLFELTNKMKPVIDSHELVAHWMWFMNCRIAEKMHDEYKTGIFRTATLTNDDVLPVAVKNWKNSVCKYVAFGASTVNHAVMGVDKYMHTTSPIRRLVDLLNMTQFQICMGVPLSDGASVFYNRWIKQIDYINEQMRAVRRVQTQCALLAVCSQNESIQCNDVYLFDKQAFDKQAFDKQAFDKQGLATFSVYLKSLNLMYKIRLNDSVNNGDTCNVSIVVFNDEDSLKKKIRLHKIN